MYQKGCEEKKIDTIFLLMLVIFFLNFLSRITKQSVFVLSSYFFLLLLYPIFREI